MEYSSKLKAALKMIQNGQRLSKQEFSKEKRKQQPLGGQRYWKRQIKHTSKKKGMELI